MYGYSYRYLVPVVCWIVLSQKYLARKLGIEGVLVLQVLLDYGTPGAVNWLCRYLSGQIGDPGVFGLADGR